MLASCMFGSHFASSICLCQRELGISRNVFENCIVVGNTVTEICIKMPQAGGRPTAPMRCSGAMETAVVPQQYLTIGGII
ncbi:hypothetical protein KIN20_030824 [Parelaphostrongylus tenuis]|uniref:Uncharacterized protein n=1 Tax=Parelaphostrongylus tenuis TaxID=148309 RepID=A0AAD5WGL4_PARTN|nr:hypothetical protein KIN20_030824 [Parelaphostrongylus tenuis]